MKIKYLLCCAFLFPGISVFAQSGGCVDFYSSANYEGFMHRFCGHGAYGLPYGGGIDLHYKVSSFKCDQEIEEVALRDSNGVYFDRQYQWVSCDSAQSQNLGPLSDIATDVFIYSPPPEGCVDIFEGVHAQANQGADRLRRCGKDATHWLPYNPGQAIDWHYRAEAFRCGVGITKVGFQDGNYSNFDGVVQWAECTGGSLIALPETLRRIATQIIPSTCGPWSASRPMLSSSRIRLKNHNGFLRGEDETPQTSGATLFPADKYMMLRPIWPGSSDLYPVFDDLGIAYEFTLFPIHELTYSSDSSDPMFQQSFVLATPISNGINSFIGTSVRSVLAVVGESGDGQQLNLRREGIHGGGVANILRFSMEDNACFEDYGGFSEHINLTDCRKALSGFGLSFLTLDVEVCE